MTLSELLKALVETDDQMARMELVESNQELLNPTETEEGGEEEGDDSSDGEDWESKYNELKQKYIDTFFNGTGEPEPEAEEEPVEEESEPEDNPSMDELLGGKE